MGRPPHAGRCSISLRASRKAALLLLQQRKGFSAAAEARPVHQEKLGGSCRSRAASCNVPRGKGLEPPEATPAGPVPGPGAGSRQLLQGALLVDLVGAVGDVGVEVPLGVLLQDVTDVLHAHLRPVPLLQVLEEPVGATVRPKGCWSVHGPARVSAHTHTRAHAQSKAPRCTHTRCWVGQLLGPPWENPRTDQLLNLK